MYESLSSIGLSIRMCDPSMAPVVNYLVIKWSKSYMYENNTFEIYLLLQEIFFAEEKIV